MSIYDAFADAPNQIKAEGSQITLVFTRTSATTGILTWNIPAPAAGCSADTRAYNGMLITGNTKAELVSNKPTDGIRYVGDPTMDTNVHLGSKIDGAFVVGAFYNDIVTNSLTVTGLKPDVSYFFDGYAIDNVARYHYDGVHSYSLPDNAGNAEEAKPSTQKLLMTSPVASTDGTGLQPNQSYTFAFKVDGQDYSFTVPGEDIVTFGDLVDELNEKFKLATNPFVGTVPPNTNGYYFNTDTNKLYKWDGFTHQEVPVIVQDDAPNSLTAGDYWYKASTDQLYRWNGTGWVLVALSSRISFSHDPTNPACDDIWHDGTLAYQWDGYVWCERQTFNQTLDPSLAPTLTCGTYWFDSNEGVVKQWETVDGACSSDEVPTNADQGYWTIKNVVYAPYNPHTPTSGALWFNDVEEKLYSWSGTDWDEETSFIVSDNAPSAPTANQYWYDEDDGVFYRRNSGNTTWVTVFVTIYSTDFTIPASCSLWLNSGNNELRVWDTQTNTWIEVTDFTISATDPSLAPVLAKCTVWYNPTTKVLKYWDGTKWIAKEFIAYATDPRTLIDGIVWFDTTNDKWFEYDTGIWNEFLPIASESDPSAPSIGTFWYESDTETLRQWNGASWVVVAHSTTPFTPTTNAKWYNPANHTLYTWNGVAWVPSEGIAKAEIDSDGNILFTTTSTGAESLFNIVSPTDVYQQLTPPAGIGRPSNGQDEVPNLPMQDQVGVGTDGTSDDRRKMISAVKMQLGWPVIQVELQPAQLELAIDQAIQELRMKSGMATRKEYFFLRARTGQQVYTLSDRKDGLNRIVSVIKITRQRAGYSGSYDNLVFSHQFIQDLYHMGNSALDLVTIEAFAQYTEMIERLFSSDIQFLWNERTRKIKIMQSMNNDELLLLETSIERTEQELMADRYLNNWIQDYARAECLEMLGRIRGKYTTLPGPNGGVTLNGPELMQQATDLKAELLMELDEMIVNNPEEWLGDIMIG